jgi:hypothetical protein
MQYATSRKVADSIPDEVIGDFNLPNPSSRTIAVGPTRSLTDMSTRNLPSRAADNLTAVSELIV